MDLIVSLLELNELIDRKQFKQGLPHSNLLINASYYYQYAETFLLLCFDFLQPSFVLALT